MSENSTNNWTIPGSLKEPWVLSPFGPTKSLLYSLVYSLVTLDIVFAFHASLAQKIWFKLPLQRCEQRECYIQLKSIVSWVNAVPLGLGWVEASICPWTQRPMLISLDIDGGGFVKLLISTIWSISWPFLHSNSEFSFLPPLLHFYTLEDILFISLDSYQYLHFSIQILYLMPS